MEGSYNEFMISFLQYNKNYVKSTSEYIKLKTKLLRSNINMFDQF